MLKKKKIRIIASPYWVLASSKCTKNQKFIPRSKRSSASADALPKIEQFQAAQIFLRRLICD